MEPYQRPWIIEVTCSRKQHIVAMALKRFIEEKGKEWNLNQPLLLS